MTDKQKEKNIQKFWEIQESFSMVLRGLDDFFSEREDLLKKGSISTIDQGFSSKKEFFLEAESSAIEKAADKLGIKKHIVKERWLVLSFPIPIYDLLERGMITFSKAKLAMPAHFDPWDDASINAAQKMADVMVSNIGNDEATEIIKKECSQIWNASTIVVERILQDRIKVGNPTVAN